MILPSRRFPSQILKQHIVFNLPSTAWLDLFSSVTPGVIVVRRCDDNWQIAFRKSSSSKYIYCIFWHHNALRLLDKDSCEVSLQNFVIMVKWRTWTYYFYAVVVSSSSVVSHDNDNQKKCHFRVPFFPTLPWSGLHATRNPFGVFLKC